MGDLEFIAEGHSKPEARTVVSQLAVQGLIAQRWRRGVSRCLYLPTCSRCRLNDTEGIGPSEDNCPWAMIASLALNKLFTDWQAQVGGLSTAHALRPGANIGGSRR